MFSRAYEWPLQTKFAESSLAKRLCGRDTPASVDADYHNGIAALRGTHPTGGAMDRQPKAHESFKPASMDAPGLPFQQGEMSRTPFTCCRPNLGPHGAFRAPFSPRDRDVQVVGYELRRSPPGCRPGARIEVGTGRLELKGR